MGKTCSGGKGEVCPAGYDFTGALTDDVAGMRIGIPKDYFGKGLDAEVREKILEAVRTLEERGAVVEEFDLRLVQYAIPAYYVIASAEASSNLSRCKIRVPHRRLRGASQYV